MSFFSALNPINWVSGVGKAFGVDKIVGGWQERKTIAAKGEEKRKDMVAQAELNKSEAMLESARTGNAINLMDKQAEGDYDTRAQDNMNKTWRDEYLCVLFTLPLIACFFPQLAPHVQAGFAVLALCPSWFILCVIGIVAATFGLRWWFSKTDMHLQLSKQAKSAGEASNCIRESR